jgi:hypothetical protein
MAKYHINKKGVPAVCRATSKPCPLGGAEAHFDSKKEAEAFTQNKMKKEHGLLTTLSLKERYKSGDEEQRIQAIKDGYVSSEIVLDPSAKVRMALLDEGHYSDRLIYDSDPEVVKKAREVYGKTPHGKIEILHNELVPPMGVAETQAGELVRATSRLIYRFFNDGDRVGVGYGKETCNSSFRYLLDMAEKLEDEKLTEALDSLDDSFTKDSEYEENLEIIAERIALQIEANPKLKEAKNTVDSREGFTRDWDYEDEEDEYDDRYPGFDSGYDEDEYDENGEDGNGYMY